MPLSSDPLIAGSGVVHFTCAHRQPADSWGERITCVKWVCDAAWGVPRAGLIGIASCRTAMSSMAPRTTLALRCRQTLVTRAHPSRCSFKSRVTADGSGV